MRQRNITTFILIAVLLLGLTSCGKGKEPTAAQAALRDELAQEYMEEIRTQILPAREKPNTLAQLGCLVSQEEKVDHLARLDAFLEAWEAGEDSVLTTCFLNKSFVTTRLQVVDGVGYYFRYEYQPKEPIAVTGKVFDNIYTVTSEQTGRVQLKLEYDKKEIAIFSFRPKA